MKLIIAAVAAIALTLTACVEINPAPSEPPIPESAASAAPLETAQPGAYVFPDIVINSDGSPEIPVLTVTSKISGKSATLLSFGYSWHDDKSGTGVIADSIAPWQGEFGEENTITVSGEEFLVLTAPKHETASYEIYLPAEGSTYVDSTTLYDDGTRNPYDSLGVRLTEDEESGRISLITPFEPGEYIFTLHMGFPVKDLGVTYAFKIIVE
ncbi:MAG: hypothetical protein LBC38_04205 [Oscillospiraceae bacterium]|jgi:hypothetical protein|nr:hypothetical protein [Oscillospiraceae bacterium]